MTTEDALQRLSALCGISPDYHDIWGNYREVSDVTRRALLAAMGIAVDTDDELFAALDELEAATWKQLLPPVQVVREGASTVTIDFSLAVGRIHESVEWRLTTENGDIVVGHILPAELHECAQHTNATGSFTRRTFLLTHMPSPGYHCFELCASGETEPLATMSLIVAPDRCYQPEALSGQQRVWGISAQLYALRSSRNWGMGDFTDLHALVDFCAQQGAGAIAVNPLHALFPDNPEHAGPYSPSSRQFINVLYLDVETIAEFAECQAMREKVASPVFQARLHALRDADQIRYADVAAAKMEILEGLFAHFRANHMDAACSARGAAFHDFLATYGDALRKLALFEALQAHFHAIEPTVLGWPDWPESYRDPESPEVSAFQDEHRDRVLFHAWLQWQSRLQLAAAGKYSMGVGLAIGLLFDLAVGVASGGAETWGAADLHASRAAIGVPPDEFNLNGQNWGLAPYVPHRLRDCAYAPFIETLRAWMSEAGALRIDHVMGFERLFWIPRGHAPTEGAYVYYPLDDLLGILALESCRNNCLVIGEDLGTVSDALRGALYRMGVLSYRLLYFTKEPDGEFSPPANYPPQSLVAVSTHDLPTLAGFWQGWDIDVRTQFGMFPSPEQHDAHVVRRDADRTALLAALAREGLDARQYLNTAALSHVCVEEVHRYIARTPCMLMMVQLEDMFGQVAQVNLPAIIESDYPNWRHRLPVALE